MKKNSFQIILAAILILAAALSRVAMYPHNFSPIIGMALFSGILIRDRSLALAMPLMAMFLSDLIFEISGIADGFWGWGQVAGYGIFALVTILAHQIRSQKIWILAGASVIASVLFFLLSNLGFFLIDNPVYKLYTQDWAGLKQCYIMALPFFRTSLLADLAYTGILFGGYTLISRWLGQSKTVAA